MRAEVASSSGDGLGLISRMPNPPCPHGGDVRSNGDRAVRRYAQKMGRTRVPETATPRASKTGQLRWIHTGKSAPRPETAPHNIRKFANGRSRKSSRTKSSPASGRPDSPSPRFRRMLCTRWALSVAVHGADDRDSGASRRRETGIVVCSPRPAQETLAAAALLGVTEFYRIGGAQAIAALAYGDESHLRSCKIVGPGNRFVTTAKKLVSFDCAIDMLAGPTEAIVIAEDGDPAFSASDLVAQAEHDPDAACIFITSSRTLAAKVPTELKNAREPTPLPRITSPQRRQSS